MPMTTALQSHDEIKILRTGMYQFSMFSVTIPSVANLNIQLPAGTCKLCKVVCKNMLCNGRMDQ